MVNLNVTFIYELDAIMLLNILQLSIKWIMKYKVKQFETI